MRIFALLLATSLCACGGDANDQRLGATCTAAGECQNNALTCLTQFKGGYCGAEGCTKNADCPEGSMCVTHTDQKNYCFLVCTDKSQCNTNRPVDVEANCSSNITRVEGGSFKACVPPSN